MKSRLLHLLATASLAVLTNIASAQPLAVDLPEEQRVRFRNPNGSCVQCSISMLGVWNNVPAAEHLLWGHPDYGKPVWGGSGPSRVASYSKERGIPIYNVTGDTMPWIEWALSTGRGCAGTFYSNHMVTFVGMTSDRQRFAICDNNKTRVIQWFTREEFYRHHSAGGRWVVILDTPAPPPKPVYTAWWRR